MLLVVQLIRSMAKSLNDLLAEKGLRPVDLARGCSVDKSTVSRWHENGVPPLRVLEVERVTGISRHDLRPDVYPLETEASA